ncbi:integral membrane protein DUF92-domain-containing protein [Suillus paluster]|uniref:integral membrane protein DUF92-domain-containing protein n=1 Tax=Suillus paluster TaxID=48578 RepID=UPI001B886F80|nr:integral membrane protein DUF92-domain-containing protein [Suillus paluster]KAG1750648.1 integral membrane protein DUF92-domain-containing protein [Suillus paluster]
MDLASWCKPRITRTTSIMAIPLIPLVIAALLSGHGLRSRSLSFSGAITAFVVGFSMLAVPVRTIGVTLFAFYLIGSRATKYGKKRKAQLEDDYQEAGYRSGVQVLCNSFTAFLASGLWCLVFAPDTFPWSLVVNSYTHSGPLSVESVAYNDGQWCPLDSTVSSGLSRAVMFVTLGHFACCLGDTLASELGILSSRPPILITTLKTVPPGTNGGVSLGGTLASLFGGLAVGVTMFISLIIENAHCRGSWMTILPSLVFWGGVAGAGGSLLDSFLGATLQRTRYSVDKKVILTGHSEPTDRGRKDTVKVISGLNLLTNNQVNLLSSIGTALAVARFST